MEQNSANTYTDLYRLAQRWFIENPGQLIILTDWLDQINRTDMAMKEKAIYAGGHKVKNASGATVPVLAAISLGMPSEELAEVIRHHGIKLEQISDCIFDQCIESPLPDHSEDAQYLSIDVWRVTSEVVKAMSQSPALSEGLEEEIKEYEDYPDLDIAQLLSGNEAFWPVTQVRRILSAKNAKASGIDSIQPYFTGIHSFSSTNANLDAFTDEELLTMLDRTGYLEMGVTVENGFSCGLPTAFFNNLFLGMTGKSKENHQRVIDALNAVQDPCKIEQITARLKESLPDYLYERDDDGVKTLGLMAQYLDQNKYGSVFDSMTIKLNVLPLISPTGAFGLLEKDDIPPCFQDLIQSEGTIFKRLGDELMQFDPSAFRHNHFSAITKSISGFETPQDVADMNLTLLLKGVLKALEAYSSKTHYSVVGSPTRKYIDEATQDVSTLILFASKQKGLNYRDLQDLPSASKALLASNGFDIRKLPGMSYRDKAQVLSDGLGI
jgi:hypothetical protein